MKAIGYIRVSTDRQATEGISLEAQQSKVSAMALLKDLELSEVITDDASGKSLNRQGIQRLMHLVERHEVQAVIITKLDRLTRRLSDLLSLMELFRRHGVTLISINESLDTETPIGRLMVNLLGSINEFERENISARVTESLTYKGSQGGCIGQVPYGFVKVGTAKQSRLEPCETEYPVLARMKALQSTGEPYSAIATTLNADGLVSRSGKPWNRVQVFKILANSVPSPESDGTKQ